MTKLIDSDEKFRLLFEHANDGIFMYELLPGGIPGPFLEINQLACQRLGYSKEEMQQKTFKDINLFDGNKKEVRAFMAKLQTTGYGSFETVHVAKDGTPIPVEINSRKITIGDKEIILSLARDLTERKRAENELIEKNQELDQFAYVISHDLKAPLRAIKNLSQWIEEDLASLATEEIHANMKLLRGRVRRMENLIQGVLEYSRIGRLKTPSIVCDVKELLLEIIQDSNPPSQFRIEISSSMPIITTQRVKLHQVFTNLINNGIKHHDRTDGHIEISSQDLGDFYEFSVTDDGPGIAPANHDKVFTIFYVLQPRDKKENTGVGLAVVKKIVEEQKGKVILKSQLGEGTTFSFTWPKG